MRQQWQNFVTNKHLPAENNDYSLVISTTVTVTVTLFLGLWCVLGTWKSLSFTFLLKLINIKVAKISFCNYSITVSI